MTSARVVSQLVQAMDDYGSGGAEQDNASNASCFYLGDAPLPALAFHATVLSVLLLFSLVGNLLVLVLVAKFKELRTRSTVISLCMVVADLLFTLSYTFPALVTTASKEWVFGDNGCIGFGFLAFDLLVTRWFTVGLLCIDRFCTVCFPFWYSRRGTWLIGSLASAAWILPFILCVIPIHLFTTFDLRENQPVCLPTCTDTHGNLCRIYYAGVITITFITGSIIPVILYSWMYHKARKMRTSAKLTMGRIVVQVASGILVSQPVGGQQPHTQRTDIRATITFALIFVTVVITGSPAYLFQLLRSISVELHCAIPIYVHFIIADFFLCAPMLTPLVIMRDRLFRTCIANLFCCGRKTGDAQIQHQSSSKLPTESMSFSTSTGDSRSQSRRSSLATTIELTSSSSSNTSSGNKPLESTSVRPASSSMHVITESCESLSDHSSR